MKVSSAVLLSALGTIIMIVIGNIIAIEYRIKREAEEREKNRLAKLREKGCTCPDNNNNL